jgi:hypothetical protein
MGMFVALPALPLVVITGYPVSATLVALLTAAAAAANTSRVIYLRSHPA